MTETFEWIISSLALVLVIEGLMPFAAPVFFRKTMQTLLFLSEKSLRIYGFSLMLIGTIIICFVHI